MKKMKTRILAVILAVFWTVSAVLPANAETGPGAEPEAETETETGTEEGYGTEPGAETETEEEADTGPETGAEAGTGEEPAFPEAAAGSLQVYMETAGGRMILTGNGDTVVLCREENGSVRAVHADGTEEVFEADLPFELSAAVGTEIRAEAAADPGNRISGFQILTDSGTPDDIGQTDVSVTIGEITVVLFLSFMEELPEQTDPIDTEAEPEDVSVPEEAEIAVSETETAPEPETDGPRSAEILVPVSAEKDGQETEGDPDAEEETEEAAEEEEEPPRETEPAAATRLLVRTDDTSILDKDAVIGVMDDVYLLQYDTREDAGDALAVYENEAEFAAEDIVIRAADYGGFAVAEGEDRFMTEAENPFVQAGQSIPAAVPGGVTALIDTGVSGMKEVAGRYSVLGDDGCDRNGHGDAMLDTIRGFHPKAEVVSIKALDDSGIGTVSTLYAAVRMAIDMHVSIINLSLSAYSTEENEAVSSIIREAVSNGIIVVGAAGNNGSDAGFCIPAGIPEAIVAAACNKAGQRLPSSNYGSTVDLFVLAGSSSYAAATLSGIISATGGIPAPDGIAVFAPSGAAAASDYVDGLCYDGMSGNFAVAGTSYAVHNAGGKRLTDLIPSLTYESLQSWLGSHENDRYYLGTPYPERIVNGIPQYILGRNGDCDNRNPNGDCGDIHGNDDYAGVAMMNCTGFVWHALWKASGLSYTDGINRIPAWGGIGAGSWKSFIQNNHLEYMTVKSGGTNEINDMLATAMYSAAGPDGKIFLEKGDIIWFWVDQIPLGNDDLPVNGYFGGLADKAHVGIYWPETKDNDNRWWDSIGICEYEGEDGYYLQNMLHHFTPKTGSVAMTIIKLGYSEPVLTKINVQKNSAYAGMTDGNTEYSFAGAVYAVYETQADAEAGTNPVTTFMTDETGYGESEEVLSAGETYYVREIEAPANGSYRIDPAVYPVEAQDPETVTKETAPKYPEIPENDPAQIIIEKRSSSGIPAAEGRSLAGTKFTIRYYKGMYTDLSGLPDPEKTWVLETKDQPDGTCRAFLLPEYKISGDDFYFLSGSPDPVLPFGTITIEETNAAEGYLLENTWKNGSTAVTGVYLAQIRKNGDTVRLMYGNTAIEEDGFTISDKPVSGGVKIRKLDEDMKLEMEGKPYAEGDKSLAGAEFTIVSKNGYAVKNKDGATVVPGGDMQVITTDEEGQAQTGLHDLPYGTYEIRETKPSAGYRLNISWNRRFSIREDGIWADLTGEEDACFEPDIRGGVQLQKTDRELEKPEALGAGSFAGITYQIINASQHAVKNRDGQIIAAGGVMQEIMTDREGIAKTGETDLPYGTYILHETSADDRGLSANDSYLSEGAKDVTFVIREDKKTVTADQNGDPIVFANQIRRRDISFRKVEEGSERPMGGIPFVIESVSTGEKHVIVTDGNGMFSSAKYTHSQNTNANDFLLEKDPEEGGIRKTDLNFKTGVWFGLGQNGSMAEPDDSLPAFPYGNYLITELSCEANGGYTLIRNYPFTIEEDSGETGGEILSLNNLHNIPILPEIRTMALDDKTGDHIMCAEEEAGLTDLVLAKNLQKGKNYILSATLTDAETGNAVRVSDADGRRIKVTGETAFTAAEESMTIPVPVAVRADVLAGKTLVVYEQLFLADEDGSRTPVAEHKEIADEDQTIRIPAVRTVFQDAESGSHTGIPRKEQKVEDTVYYSGLLPGREVRVTATVMTVGEDGNPAVLKGRSGEIFQKTVTFTPEKSEGSVKIGFVMDSELLSGRKAVCFEEIRYGDIPVAIHADINDRAQTIWYPEIRTTAVDKATGEHEAALTDNSTFLDRVSFSGLEPEKTYVIKAVLMDAETGRPAEENGREITAEKIFVPKTESGEVTVEIPVNTRALAGRKTVVFEELFIKDQNGNNGTPVAEHRDLKDTDQQIHVPEIRTCATEAASGTHRITTEGTAEILDTITYRNLTPGMTYVAKGVLMDAEAGKVFADGSRKKVTGETTFVPKAPDGTVKVRFRLDTAGSGDTTVTVFEELYRKIDSGREVFVAEHKDISDTEQQVKIRISKSPKTPTPTAIPTAAPEVTPTGTPAAALTPDAAGEPVKAAGIPAARTGDPGTWRLYLLLLAGAAAVGTGFLLIKKKKKL